MTVFQCICGAKYKVPAGSAGRKVRCKQCGRIEQLPRESEGPLPLAADSHFGVEAAAATASGSMFDSAASATGLDDLGLPPTPRVDAAPPAGFWSDVGWSFLFFTTPHSLVIFCVVWGLTVLATAVQWVPIVGLIVSSLTGLFITAWYMSIIAETAGGEDELPSFSVTEGWWDSVLVPALRYTGTWLVLLLPAIVYALFISGTLSNLLPLLQSGANPALLLRSGGAEMVGLVLLVCAAIFLWPIALMCVSMGGLGSLLRIDLIVISVARTFPPYTLIVIMIGMATVLPELIIGAAAGAAGGVGLTAQLWLLIVAGGVRVYFSIIAMRLIGLYYRHYKDRLAWDWE